MQLASFRTLHVAIPHPALDPSLRSGRATFPPGEGLVPDKSKYENMFPKIRIKNHALAFCKGVIPLLKLLFPVVPDVLDIVVIFHDVDELFHSKPSVSGGNQEKHWGNTKLTER